MKKPIKTLYYPTLERRLIAVSVGAKGKVKVNLIPRRRLGLGPTSNGKILASLIPLVYEKGNSILWPEFRERNGLTRQQKIDLAVLPEDALDLLRYVNGLLCEAASSAFDEEIV